MLIPDPRCRGFATSTAEYSAVRGIGRCYRGMDLGVSGIFRGGWYFSAVPQNISRYAEMVCVIAILDSTPARFLECFAVSSAHYAVRGLIRGTAK